MLKLVLWGTLIMASSLFIVLGLLLVLLAELYCSLLRSSPDSKLADEEEQPPLSGRERVATSLRLIGLISASPLATKGATQRQREDTNMDDEEVLEGADASDDIGNDHFVYISNPIYDQVAAGAGTDVDACSGGTCSDSVTTPFETPDSSPSHLEVAASGSKEAEEEEGDDADSLRSPPIAPMKKLPPRAASVTLSGTTDSNVVSSSSSSSSSPPCNSPSW